MLIFFQHLVKFVWSSLKYGVDESLLPGRCHSVVSLGDKIIYFGGSAANSSNVSVFSVPPTDELNVLLDVESEEDCDIAYLTAPELVMNWNRETTVARKSIIPCNRCSASSVALGRYMIIFGGWSNTRKELGDFWALDLAPGHQFANQKANEKHSNAQLAQSILDTEFDEISYLERLASRNTDSIESIPLDDEEVLHGIMQLMASKVSRFQNFQMIKYNKSFFANRVSILWRRSVFIKVTCKEDMKSKGTSPVKMPKKTVAMEWEEVCLGAFSAKKIDF